MKRHSRPGIFIGGSPPSPSQDRRHCKVQSQLGPTSARVGPGICTNSKSFFGGIGGSRLCMASGGLAPIPPLGLCPWTPLETSFPRPSVPTLPLTTGYDTIESNRKTLQLTSKLMSIAISYITFVNLSDTMAGITIMIETKLLLLDAINKSVLHPLA